MATPTRRIIYLRGVDTGLSAFTRREAVSTLLRVLQRRGDYRTTEADLDAAYSTARGRVDFFADHANKSAPADLQKMQNGAPT